MPAKINPLLLLVSLALSAVVSGAKSSLPLEPHPGYANRPAQQPKGEAATFSAEQVKADLKYLYKTLHEAHYDLYAHTRKDVFEKEYKRIEASIQSPLTLHEIHNLFQPFVALSNIGHCHIGYHFGQYGGEGNTLFPFDVIVREGRVLISRNYITDARFVPGDELISLNGRPINDVVIEIEKHIAGERRYIKDAQLEGISFPRLFWFVHGNRDSYSVQVKKKSGETISAQVEAVKARTFDQERGGNIPCRFERDFKILDRDTAYLYPGPFFNFSGEKMYDDAAFLRFLESSFTEISKSKVGNLIVDLRDNPGGNNSFSDPMIAYFASKKFRFCSKYYLKTSRVLKDFWTHEVPKSIDMADPEIARLSQAILSHPDGEKFEYTMADYAPRTDALRFRGKVYVLINRHSYSNATSAAAVIQDYGFGELIGEETSDVPTSHASGASFDLPITKIKVTYPKGYFIRPSGDRKLKGVIPDHLVIEDPFTKEDEVLEYALQRIKTRK